LEHAGFQDIKIKGFDIFGEALKFNLYPYADYKKTGILQVKINDDTSIMYIGKAVKGQV
jgi:2-polyprenyl-6-hydroxyphenyl methylase / 3-demethylubiquinone-9 3-methyltransferase